MDSVHGSPAASSHEYAVWTWQLKANTEGSAIPVLDYNRAAVQLAGSLGGAHVALQGRLGPINDFSPINDQEGFAIAGLRDQKMTEVPNLMVAEIKPVVIGGSEETEITVTLVLKR